MAVIYPLREVYAFSAKSLSVSPPAGRAAIIHAVEVVAPSAGWATLKSGLVTVGFFEIGPDVRNHLRPSVERSGRPSLLDQLRTRGLFKGYPVVEGDTFSVSTDVTFTWARIVYEEVEAADVTGEEQDAKNAKERLTVFYGTNSAAISAATYSVLDKSLMPSEFKAWPFEMDVPPGYAIDVHGLAFLEVEENSYTGSADTYIRTKQLRMKVNRETRWHPNEDGFYVLGDGADAGSANVAYGEGTNVIPYAGNDKTGQFYFLPEPLKLISGDEMILECNFTLDANAELAAERLRAALITMVKKV